MVLMKVYLILCNVIDNDMMVLQSCMDFLKVDPGSISETCPAFSYDENQITDIKVEEASDTQEVQDPLLITLPEIRAEHGVSCMSVCPLLGSFERYPELCNVFLISFWLSVCFSGHMKDLHSTERIVTSSLENVSTALHLVAHCLCSNRSILLNLF
jgi:hypothetical protein